MTLLCASTLSKSSQIESVLRPLKLWSQTYMFGLKQVVYITCISRREYELQLPRTITIQCHVSLHVWWYARTRWCRSENWVIAPKREIETIYGLVISCVEDREAPSGADPGFFLKKGRGGTTKDLPFLRCLTLNLQPRLMFYFNTNKPQFFLFLHNTSCFRKPHRRSSWSYSPNISHMKDCTALKLGEAFCIFTFFLSLSSFWPFAWSVVISVFKCATEWKPATKCRMRIGTQESQGSTKLKLYRDVYNFQGRVEIFVS